MSELLASNISYNLYFTNDLILLLFSFCKQQTVYLSFQQGKRSASAVRATVFLPADIAANDPSPKDSKRSKGIKRLEISDTK